MVKERAKQRRGGPLVGDGCGDVRPQVPQVIREMPASFALKRGGGGDKVAARHVERNPVRAGLVRRAWDRPRSSAAGHVKGRGDALVAACGPLVVEVNGWRRLLQSEEDEAMVERLRRHGRTGRPLRDAAFIARLETRLDRRLHRRKAGPKPKRQR